MRAATSTLALFTALALVACDDDPSGPDVMAPGLTYAQVAHVVAFFSTGSTAAPTIEWNGETGTLSLAAPVTGVSIDPSTGVVSWDESLPIGVNTVDVVATNSAGTDMVALEIDNQFQGYFEGMYNNDPESQTVTNDVTLTFEDDGTVTIVDQGTTEGTGTWTRDGTTITSVVSADGGANWVTIEGDITHDTEEATFEGFFYQGEEAVAGAEEGYMVASLTPLIS